MVKVKPLVWDGEEGDCFVFCDVGWGIYELVICDTLERSCDYAWKASYYQPGKREVPLGLRDENLAGAKAAAQADHEARILANIQKGGDA